MFAVGYSALTSALDKRRDVEARLARIGELQTAFRILQQDAGQIAPRPVRDILGNGTLPAVDADPRTTTLAAWTRAGWANPAGVGRGTLQRVQYELDGETLIRQSWPVLDITQSSKPIRRKLLTKVRSAEFRFLDGNHDWQTQWPPSSASGVKPSLRLRMRPIAVEVRLELTDFGKVSRWFETPG